MNLHLVSSSASQAARMRETGTVVLITGRGDTLYQGLARAIESYLPGIHVLLVRSIDDVTPRDGRVELILVAAQDLEDEAGLSKIVGNCREKFPAPALGIMIPEMKASLDACRGLFQARMVQGLLPFTLKLDVWLAAMSLLLSGGEFYPFLHAVPEEDPAANRAPLSQDASRPLAANQGKAHDEDIGMTPAQNGHDVLGLTLREAEIMEMISQGHQNKVIADLMSLSEHTVKVHVHNIITKLRVSNRTQAVAAMRAARERTGKPSATRTVFPHPTHPRPGVFGE